MKNNVINFGSFLAIQRQNVGLKKSDLARLTGIDAAIISKIESGSRVATREQVIHLANHLATPVDLLLKKWLSEKIYQIVAEESFGYEVLLLAEERAKYEVSRRTAQNGAYPDSLKAKLEKLDALKMELSHKKPANAVQLQKLRDFFSVQYTYDSNRIEGNTLTFQETHLVINEGMTIGGKSMREHLEAINHSEAIDYLYDVVAKKRAVNERMLKDLHHLVLKGIDRDNAGRYRSVPVRIGGSSFVPAQPYLVPKLMEEVFEFYETHKRTLHPVVLAAEMHERVVTVHPFIDGNGRTSRLIMNLILMMSGFTIVNLKGDYDSRMRYYAALEKSQAQNDKSDFIDLIVEHAIFSLREHISAYA